MNENHVIDQQVDILFTELLEVSRQQFKLLNNAPLQEDISSELLTFTEQKKTVIEKIEQLKTSDNYSKKQLDKQTIDTINTIQVLDVKCQELIKVRMNQVADKIKSARDHKKAYHAYTADTSYDGGCFFDGKK